MAAANLAFVLLSKSTKPHWCERGGKKDILGAPPFFYFAKTKLKKNSKSK